MDGFHTVPVRRRLKNQTLNRSSSLSNVAHHSEISHALNNTNAYNLLDHSPPSPVTSNNKKKRKRKSKLSTVSTPEQQVPELVEPETTSSTSSSATSQNMFSFWDYLRDEVTVSDFDTTQEVKRERITNFLGVPTAVEKVQT